MGLFLLILSGIFYLIFGLRFALTKLFLKTLASMKLRKIWPLIVAANILLCGYERSRSDQWRTAHLKEI